jgi:hypothetical protein
MKCACAIFSSEACHALNYFSTSSLKRYDFRKTVIAYEIRVLIFYTALSKIFFILRISVQDMVKNVHGLLVKYLSFLFDLNVPMDKKQHYGNESSLMIYYILILKCNTRKKTLYFPATEDPRPNTILHLSSIWITYSKISALTEFLTGAFRSFSSDQSKTYMDS